MPIVSTYREVEAMRRINVRCCCQPTKILGTLPWDETSPSWRFTLMTGGYLQLHVASITHLPATLVPEIGMDKIHPDLDDELLMIKREPAFKAEGAPLDQLRLIPEFKEGDMVYHFPTSEQRAMSASNIAEIGVGIAMAGSVVDRKIFETPLTVLASLTAFEQTIFNRLKQGRGSVVSKDELVQALYPNGPSQNPNSNGVEVFVARLRRKIGEHRITTIRGKGYRLHPETPVNINVAAE